MKKIAVVALFASVVATPVLAENIYAGAKFGSTSHSYTNVNNNNQTGAGFFLGFKVNEMFAIEADYMDLGGFDTPTSNIKGTGMGVSGVLTSPINQQFAVFGKLGIASTTLKETAGAGFVGGPFTRNNTGLSFGLGGEYHATPMLDIRAGLDMYPVGDAVSTKGTASVWYVGGLVRF
jgi:OmpA-OmpF porin, OOP family